jgi:hypothetical protein
VTEKMTNCFFNGIDITELVIDWAKNEQIRSELCRKARLNPYAYFYAYEKFEHVIYADYQAAIALSIAYFSIDRGIGAKTLFEDIREKLR